MGRTIDNRVVEMEFDNAKFEKNVSQSLSTLDKLKAALSFKNVDDNFENVEHATDKLGKSFSALEAIAVGALMNIGSKVADWAAKTIRELSGVENVIEGFKKFGQITTSSATLAAQGFDVTEIETQLKRLNWFTDETSYNLTDMVDNISKFTASGQGLTESADAMQGIALWAALSGQNAGTASRAMYQLSQAMGSGYMRLEDWKSIQNANMDTDEFRQHVLDAAVALGTLKKNADGTYQSLIEGLKKEGSEAFTKSQFTKNLTSGMWFTKDVMMTVYKEYAKGADEIYEYIQSHAGATVDDALEALGDSLDEFGKKAFEAGQRARTWEDAINSVKDALSTKWMGIFQSIFGNFEEATNFFTDLSYAFYDMFVEPMSTMSEAFNLWDEEGGSALLRGKIVEGLYLISEWIGKVKKSFENFFYGWEESDAKRIFDNAVKLKNQSKEFVKNMTDSGSIDKKIMGTLKEAEDAYKDIREDYSSELDNEEEVRENYIIEQKASRLKKLSDGFANLIDRMAAYNDETHVFSRILNGVFAAVNLFQKALSGAYQAVKPFFDIFTGAAKKVFGVLANIGDWFVKINKKASETNFFYRFFTTLLTPLINLRKAFRSFVDELIPRFKERFAGLSEVSGALGESFDKIKAKIKEIFSDFIKWWKKLFTNFNPTKAVDGLFNAFESVRNAFYNLTGLKPGELTEKFQNALENIKDGLETFRQEAPKKVKETWFKIRDWFSDAFSWVKEHWDEISAGIKTAWEVVWNFIKGVWEGAKSLFQKTGETGENAFDDLKESVKTIGQVLGALFQTIVKGLKPITDGLKNMLENINLGQAGGALAGGGLMAIGASILKFAKSLKDSNILKGISEILDGFGGVLDSFAHTLDAKALKEAAIAIAILVGSLFVLCLLPLDQLSSAALVISSVVAVIAKAMSSMSSTSKMSIDKTGFSKTGNSSGMMFLEIAAGLLLMAFALKKIASIPTDDLYTALTVIVILVAVMTKAVKALTKMYANKGETNITKNAGNKFNNNAVIKMGGPAATLLAFALMMWVVGKTVEKISNMVVNNLAGFIVGVVVIAGLILGMTVALKKLDGVDLGKGLASTIVAFAAFIFIVALSIKMLSGIEDKAALLEAGAIIILVMAVIGIIIASTKGRSFKSFPDMAKGLRSVAVTIGILALVIWALSKLTVEEILKGGITVVAIGGLLIAIAKLLSGKSVNAAKVQKLAKTLLLFSGVIAILAGVIYALGQLSWKQLGIGAIGLLAIVAAISALAVVGSKTGNGLEKVGKVFMYIGIAGAALSVGILAVAKAIEILSTDTLDIKKAFDNISKIIDEIIAKLPEWLAAITVAVVTFVTETIAEIIIRFVNMIDDLIEKFKENDTIKKLVNGFIDVAIMVIDAVTARIDELVNSAFNFVLELFRSVGDWLTSHKDEVKEALSSFVQGVIDVILSLLEGLMKSIFELLTGGSEEDWDAFKTSVSEYVSALVGTVLTLLQPLIDALNEILSLFSLVNQYRQSEAEREAAEAALSDYIDKEGRLKRLEDHFINEVIEEYRNNRRAMGYSDDLDSYTSDKLIEKAKKKAQEYFWQGYDVPEYTNKLLDTQMASRYYKVQKMLNTDSPSRIWAYLNSPAASSNLDEQWSAYVKEHSSEYGVTYNYNQTINTTGTISMSDSLRYSELMAGKLAGTKKGAAQ